MRNLSLVGERRRHVQFDGNDAIPSNDHRHIVDMFQTVDDGALVVNGSRFILTNDGILSKINESGGLEWVSHLDNCVENPGGKWFNMAYLDTTTEEQIACISRNGAIVSVSPVTGDAELCGEFEHGLEGACWSPDQESILLLTFEEDDEDEPSKESGTGAVDRKSVLLMMNSQWEVLAETTIDSHVPSEISDDSSVSISFRPDGSLCALSTVDAADNLRKVRFFKRESLAFHAIGRTEDGSGKLVPNMIASAGIAWAGAGCSQLLATAQRKGKKTIQIIFFEPNGLRHREFPLRESPSTDVLGLTWNVESDLLAIILREEGGCDKVQLWHRSNYHWYLKQELRYGKERVASVVFDEEKPYILYTYFEKSLEWREYEFLWQSSTVHITSAKTCTAYAIDGSRLNMTPLHKALVPPPMYAATLDLACPIRQICFCDDNLPVDSIVHLSDGSIVLLKRGTDPFSPPDVLAEGCLAELDAIDHTSLRSFVVVDTKDSHIKMLAVACAGSNTSMEKVVVLELSWDESNQSMLLTRSCDDIPLQQSVMSAVPWSDARTGALLGLCDGSLWEYDISENGSGGLHPCPDQEFVEPCPLIAGLKNVAALDGIGNAENGHEFDRRANKRLVFGLSSRYRLYCRDVLLADAVSSFFVSRDHQFLCYATAQGSKSQLRFLPLKDLESFDILLGSDENHVLGGFDPRSVERGARIVAILPGSPQAVLQVPRGNLEGIYPRALVLRFVMNMICSGNYGAAFTMMRRQKVNLNLIVDLNPRKFLENDIPTFLKQVTAINHLNLFISCLQNWDSTNTQYRVPPWFHLESETDVEAKKVFDFSTKINQVCRKMRSKMIEAERGGCLQEGRPIATGHFLLPILSTFAKEVPPRLEDALTLIKENAEQSSSGSKKPPLFSDNAQSSIQYLAFLADYELLFETALGMYDFDLARAIARNSQLDPKKYLPLLRHYREAPKYFGRYEVDMRLKRYEMALRNLFESMQQNEKLDGIQNNMVADGKENEMPLGNDFDDCMFLISNYQLHGVGLELFEGDQTKKRTIMLSLGDYLMNESKAASALTVFLATDPVDVVQAMKAARSCRNWKVFFSLSVPSDEVADGDADQQRRKAAREIAEEIAAASEEQYSSREGLGDAARILLDYCEDVPGAVDMLLKGKLWQESCRIAALHGRNDLLRKGVEASIFFAETTVTELEERKDTFVSTMKRYDEVIEIRKEAARAGDTGADEAHGVTDDNGSVFSATSNASNMSLQSNMSSDSLSSVISIKSVSSFSISGAEETTRHKSKFNQIGGKKKKKKKQGRNRMRPGSAEELKSLVETLRSSCIDDDLCKVISDTIEFLSQTSGAMDTAVELYKSYVAISDAVQEAQNASLERKKHSRLAKPHEIPISLPEEEEVEDLSCPKLSASIYEVFSILRM